MPKLLATLSFILLTIGFAYAQHATVRGSVTDTSEKKGLADAVIMALRSKDSIMVGYTRTDQSGKFVLPNLPQGKIELLVTFPRYADYVDEINLKDSTDIDIHRITMILRADLLKAFVVNGNAAIRLKGDTTEFKADSFKVQPNATVEDLLKVIPSIQVDKNGKITAQGQTVQKVLVDGEEFFGDDPTLVTRNLRADMVDKVQVYDKKSDQAAFTGIDDGQKQKTINIKLKEDKKNGYFGRLSAGAGTGGYHDSQVLFNKFQKKEKLAFYGIVSNTGTTGLNWQDQNSFGGGNGMLSVDANGNVIGMDDISGWNGSYSGQGYPLVQTGGAHYNNKWDNDVQSVNFNYKVLQLFVNGNSTSNSENILPDSTASYYQNQAQKFNNQIMRNKLGGIYELQFDTSSSLKLTVDGTMIHKLTSSTSSTQSLLVYDSSMLNNGNSSTTTTTDNNSFNSDLIWKKKIKKKSRSLSIDVTETYSSTKSSGYLRSLNNFFAKDTLSFSQLTDQYKTDIGKNLTLTSNAYYTEPISAASSIIANYGLSVNNSSADKLSFNKSGTGKYDSLDPANSSNYAFNTLTQKAGLYYSYVRKKINIYVGSAAGYSSFKQKDLFLDTVGTRNFINWYPQASLRLELAPQNSLFLAYNGNTTQPTLQQIQPIQNNADPLNILLGNSALKPAFQNNIRLQYWFFRAISGNNLWTNFNYSFTNDAISTNSYVDSLGRKVTQSINVNGNFVVSANVDYGLKWKKPDIYFNANFNVSENRNNSVVNNQANTTNSSNYTFGLGMGKYKEGKLDISMNGSATFTKSTSSIQLNMPIQYWSYQIQPNIDFFLPLKFQIHSDLNYTLRQKTAAFPGNYDVALWNGWFGKKFLKSDQLLVKFSANDILNQNKGVTRNVSSNFISQNTNSTIQRYFMFSVVWNFNKTGGAAPSGGNGIFIAN